MLSISAAARPGALGCGNSGSFPSLSKMDNPVQSRSYHQSDERVPVHGEPPIDGPVTHDRQRKNEGKGKHHKNKQDQPLPCAEDDHSHAVLSRGGGSVGVGVDVRGGGAGTVGAVIRKTILDCRLQIADCRF